MKTKILAELSKSLTRSPIPQELIPRDLSKMKELGGKNEVQVDQHRLKNYTTSHKYDLFKRKVRTPLYPRLNSAIQKLGEKQTRSTRLTRSEVVYRNKINQIKLEIIARLGSFEYIRQHTTLKSLIDLILDQEQNLKYSYKALYLHLLSQLRKCRIE